MFGRILVKGTMLLANLAVAALLIVTVLASNISPEKISILALTTLIFPLTIVLNLFFVAFWLFARKWQFLISFLLLIFFSEQISTSMPIHFREKKLEPSTNSIKIMSYNTMLFAHIEKHTSSNPNKIIKHILDSDADIVCLQEYAVSPKKKSDYLTQADIYRIFKKYPYKHIELRPSENWKRSGIATFSKYPIINTKKFSSKADYGVSIYTDIVVGTDTVRLFNNHLESNRLTERDRHLPIDLKEDFNSDKLTGTTKQLSRKLFIAYKRRAKQADNIALEIKKSPYKVLVCGDFNDVPASYTYSTIRGNLTDAFSTTGLGLGLTLNLSIYRFRIDYILYDERFFSSSKLIIDKVKYSDHYPIHTKISFKQKS